MVLFDTHYSCSFGMDEMEGIYYNAYVNDTAGERFIKYFESICVS